MRKHYFKLIAIILTVICIILSVVLISMKFISFRNEAKGSDIHSKVLSEIKYLDSSVIEAMNKLNNISVVRYKVYTKSINKPDEKSDSNSRNEDQQKNTSNSNSDKKQNSNGSESSEEDKQQNEDDSEQQNTNNTDSNKMNVSQTIPNNSLTETNNENIDWDEITYIYENLYSTWPTVKLDLKKLDIQDEYINKFNLDLNGVAQSINNKDKNSALVNFYNLYSLLPNYLMATTNDAFVLNSYNSKAAILNAYTLANEENKWNEMSESVAKAKVSFNNLFQIVDENDNRRANIEKTYAIINDLENCIVLNDKNIFYMQYKNAIQSLETL